MDRPSSLGRWAGNAALTALALGCGGAEGETVPGEKPPAPVTAPQDGKARVLVKEIAPAQVAKRPPQFVSVAPRQAWEGRPYLYSIDAEDPDGEEVNLTLVRAPEGAVLDGSLLKWTPSPTQADHRQRFTLRAADPEGAARVQDWTLVPRAGHLHGVLAGPRHHH